MANRILLDATGMKISKPGVDVLTAGKGQLNFSSDWSSMTLLMTGKVTLLPSHTQTIMFGKTFNYVPLARLPWQQSTSPGNWYYFTLSDATVGTAAMKIFTDRLVLTNPSSTVTYIMAYRIWDYNP